ncbi:hypothetical protein IVB14_28585 [Bradyrhizobium sp. 180]|uniref:hypothetical protein n=1 Tax=unclassified Bradyrhizobium TaxID=2631580 RepID=UPI001FFB030B|nr:MULTISPECIES: hypothetical protein [unclassified Bradyrhizobium]MCK1421780.1 hypothetical protein [Bradyrhizobium sp. CW12]MCK1494261.1 hypothetical protein [Bradyrhizobium sp. 180]MCK1530541.1 hypothetical protein [Bradyrhizobium sp. 182]MCK1594886.1 hypothetical protein [Bradyrhizobium sp. 164]MCK1615748.1 hypothetical protein [Bradyrhizobium sp. 159]
MRNIADVLGRFWQASQPASDTQVEAMAENRDQSSMADFVRILQAYDQDQWGDRARPVLQQVARPAMCRRPANTPHKGSTSLVWDL